MMTFNRCPECGDFLDEMYDDHYCGEELRECNCCSTELPEDDLKYYDGAYFCHECLVDYIADEEEYRNLTYRGIYALSL